MPGKIPLPVVQLENCLVRPLSDTAAATANSLFARPLTLTLGTQEKWAVTGPRKQDLLSVLAGQHVVHPPLGRSYPFLEKAAWPSQVIQFLQFRGSIPVTHLSARYEHFRDEFDESLDQFLARSAGVQAAGASSREIEKVKHMLKLDWLGERWVVGLSNGQMRRARLARAVLKHPRLLVIDDPYLGLDPSSRQTLSDVLEIMPPNPHVVLGLRVQDHFPSWITHVAITDKDGIAKQGAVHEVRDELEKLRAAEHERTQATLNRAKSQRARHTPTKSAQQPPLLHIDDISIAYNGQPVLKNLTWTVRRGEKWHLRGDNGTGKSTLLSLITADHPQSWNSKIVIDNVPRKTGRQSYFGINEGIGHAAPEIHALFPGGLTVHQAVATGFIVGSFVPPAAHQLSSAQQQRIDSLLTQFGLAPETHFRDLSLSDQKTVLFLRAVAKQPDLLILDEAFSAMDAHRVEQCKAFMSTWQGTVVAVGHVDEELPVCDKFIRLYPECKPAVVGEIEY